MSLSAVITSALALSPAQIYQLARDAGFPASQAVTMTAVALRESNGYPGAYNGNTATGDNSYGLWQINMLGNLGPARLAQFGLSDPKQLLDPATNARAAYLLWAGNDANLQAAWDVNGTYNANNAVKLQQYMPLAQQAAMQVDGTAPGPVQVGTPDASGVDASGQSVASTVDFSSSETWMVLAGAGLLALIMLVKRS